MLNVSDVCFAKGPTLHKSMSMQERCQASMEGLLCLDLFRIIADVTATRRGFPRGAQFLAPQTVQNLQLVCVSTILITVSKHEAGDPFCEGNCRMTELAIEQWFGRLRVQSQSAEHTARSYWHAACRDMIRTCKRNGTNSQPNERHLPPITAKQFKSCSQKALDAALFFVAHCSGVTVASLEAMYREWCQSGRLDAHADWFGGIDEIEEDHESDQEVEEEDNQCKKVLDEISETMKREMGEAERSDDEDCDPCQMDLRDAPDQQELKELVTTVPDSPLKPFTGPQKLDFDPDSIPRTLREALWDDPNAVKDSNLWDRLWRLTMSLRYWKGGGDRNWIKNPRSSRKAAAGLSWYQFLVQM